MVEAKDHEVVRLATAIAGNTGPSKVTPVEAMHRLLFNGGEHGFSVLLLKRRVNDKAVYEPHAFSVDDAAGWCRAAETAEELKVPVNAFACVHRSTVLLGIGSLARRTDEGDMLTAWQSVLAFRWDGAPTEEAQDTFIKVGGHLISTAWDEIYGVLPLEESRRLGELTSLGREVARSLGALRYSLQLRLPVPGTGRARFLTDEARVLSVPRATGDALVEAGLRPSAPRWSA